ncbi:hypothetical protein RND71_008514 [Anisodus tanguticus]|uniref:Pectinesterase n=1 Tax=Anisodus tanguticus TaxID=243964 RepID=A0AAE1SNX1_9SOLA|nr:hypothetical protein RND71_008514 [Anisodus tanguticus]
MSIFGKHLKLSVVSGHHLVNVAPVPGPGAVGAQAVAIRIGGDQAAFWGCGFFGAQDTLHDDRGRHYFKECYIQGSIDFVFGNGKSLYEIPKLSPSTRIYRAKINMQEDSQGCLNSTPNKLVINA